jgi:hypothetical protein
MVLRPESCIVVVVVVLISDIVEASYPTPLVEAALLLVVVDWAPAFLLKLPLTSSKFRIAATIVLNACFHVNSQVFCP